MRVAFVIDDLDPRRGGMSQWCSQFVTAVANQGYDLHMVSQGFGDAPLAQNLTCHPIPRTRSRIEFAAIAAKIVNTLNADIVHDTGLGTQFDIFQPHGGSYAAWVARRLDFYPRWVRAMKRPIDALLPRQREFDRHAEEQYKAGRRSRATFVALSNFVADGFEQYHQIRPDRIKVIYNGVDCRRFSSENRDCYRDDVRRQLRIEDSTITLLLAAHNFRLKGVSELMRVTSRLVSNGRPVHLIIAGGKHLAKWQLTANRLGLAGRISFLGAVADMVRCYSAADVYVHPTYYDPCSLVLLEAAASGLPIVTTRRCNGAVELFREGESILTVGDPSDFDALYEKVDALFDDRLRAKMGTAARDVALQHPFEKNVAEVLRLYEARSRARVAA
jgi:UDP-glucose:(heptosyl)LPS alpha-1,3-glucosyltransferase